MTFRLAAGADEEAFLAADRRVQTEFAYHQPGLLRRTTGRGAGGTWIVIDLWRGPDDADAVDAVWGRDPVTAAFMALVDGASMTTARYDTLD
ncbi:MAG: hypothetical protein ACRDY1_00250 [Acidimicrobiales bacterium]